MPRGSIIVLLLPALAEESWREDLGLHKTGQEQRRAAHWLADLDQAINFDLDTLATDHALRRSQISEEGWVATHARWLARSECAYQREGSTQSKANVQTTMRDGANPIAAVHTTDELKLTRHRDNGDYDGDGVEDALDVSIHPVCVGEVDISSGGPCPDALCVSADAPWSIEGFARRPFCPAGVGAPQATRAGYYATGGAEGARSREAPCEPGYRCHLGVRHACAPGTHEPATGVEATQVDAAQCRPCPPGHYCPRATGAAKPCPAGTYGNVIGNETGLADAACSGPCHRGHYCPEGSVLPTPCPPGTFGNQTGLTTAACSAACFPDSTGECSPSQCEEGYYCPAGSTHGRERECGEGHFCPAGSGAPLTPDDGMFGVAGGGATRRAGQADCEDCCPDGVPACPAPRRELYASHYA